MAQVSYIIYAVQWLFHIFSPFTNIVPFNIIMASFFMIISIAETSSLTEQIRHGKLRPMLDLGVTPSQVSLQGGSERGEEVDGVDQGVEETEKGDRSYCIPLQSLGLGGNKITCLGAGSLANGLKTNTSQ